MSSYHAIEFDSDIEFITSAGTQAVGFNKILNPSYPNGGGLVFSGSYSNRPQRFMNDQFGILALTPSTVDHLRETLKETLTFGRTDLIKIIGEEVLNRYFDLSKIKK